MEFTGERYVPGNLDHTAMAYEHWQRYIAAGTFVQDKIVLDIACGEGYGTNMLAGKARRVYGVDISKETIDHAISKYERSNLSFQCGSVEKLDFDDHYFDVVVSFETIEHVDEKMQVEFLKEAKRVLKRDGVLIISCPNKLVASDKAWVNWGYKNKYHLKEHYLDEFRALLESYFKLVHIAYQRHEVALLLSSSTPKSKYDVAIQVNEEGYEEFTQNLIAICSEEYDQLDVINSIVLYNGNEYLNLITEIASLQKELQTIMKLLANEREESHNLTRELKDNFQTELKTLESKLIEANERNKILQLAENELNRIKESNYWKLSRYYYRIKDFFLQKKERGH